MPRGPGTTRRLVAALALFTAVAITRPATASQGDATLWLGSALANARGVGEGPTLGIAGQTGIEVGMSDFWGISAGIEGAYHFGRSVDDGQISSFTVENLTAGFRYDLDVFTYVPFIGLSVSAFLETPPDSASNPRQTPGVGAKATVGLEWRFDRHWSFGFKADLHTIDFDLTNFPDFSTAGLLVGYHFRL